MHPSNFAPFARSSKTRIMHLEPAAPDGLYRSESSQQRRAKARTADRRALRTLKHQPAVLVALPTVYIPPSQLWSF